MLNGRRVSVRLSAMKAIDDEASIKSISIVFYGDCNYIKSYDDIVEKEETKVKKDLARS